MNKFLGIIIITLVLIGITATHQPEESLKIILDSLPDEIPSFSKKMSSFLSISTNDDQSLKNMKKEGYFCASCKSLFQTLSGFNLSLIRLTISEVMEMMCKYYWKQNP